MRALLLALAGLFCFSAFGQRSIILEEKIDAPFRLAVDGYLQNSQPLRRWVLKNLPADSLPVYIIPGRGGQPPVFRYLHLPDKGQYRYVVTRNFAGKLQLRYRGQAEQYPSDYPQIAFSRDLDYRPPQGEAEGKEVVSAQAVPTSELTPPSPPQEQAAASNELAQPREKSPKAQKAQEKPTGANTAVEDAMPASPKKTGAVQSAQAREKRSQEPKAASPDPKAQGAEDPLPENPRQEAPAQAKGQERREAPRAIDTLRSEAPRAAADSGQVAVFARELQTLKYEFERLAAARRFLDQFKPAPQAIPHLLEAFRYDQSRLEFINEILAEWPDWVAHLPEWLPYLDYEMSRRKLEKKWHEK